MINYYINKADLLDMFSGNKDDKKSKLKDKDTFELLSSLNYSACHHNSYKIYYPSINIAESIIENKMVIARRDCYEDKIDNENINDFTDDYVKYMVCFTFSQSESVAMWKIYAHNGGMISYSKKDIENIIKENFDNEIEIGYFDKKQKDSDRCFTKKFSARCKMELVDVLYFDNATNETKNDSYYIKRSSDTIKNASKTIIDSLPNYVKKSNVWNYENECRLIVKIPMSEFREYKISECNAVKIKLPDEIIKNIKITLTPFCDIANEKPDIKYTNSKIKDKINF